MHHKPLEMLLHERRGIVKTIVMEPFNGILFKQSGPANKQHTNQSIIRQNVLQNGFVYRGDPLYSNFK